MKVSPEDGSKTSISPTTRKLMAIKFHSLRDSLELRTHNFLAPLADGSELPNF
jgi:hypothetical protein